VVLAWLTTKSQATPVDRCFGSGLSAPYARRYRPTIFSLLSSSLVSRSSVVFWIALVMASSSLAV
jgi:hypothetical protein